MRVIIEDFQGCAAGDINATPGALLAGKNGQGKSSALRAIAAVLSGNVMPLSLKKGESGMLVRTGAAKASVMATGANGHMATAVWPKAERTTAGDAPPEASPFAVGLVHWVDMKEADRIEALRRVLKTEPSEDDLRKALLSRFLPDFNWTQEPKDERERKQVEWATSKAAAIYKEIERDGWDATLARYTSQMRDSKAQWSYVTGDGEWGSKKAEAWLPSGWEETLSNASKDGLAAIVTEAKAKLEDAVSRQAVDTTKLGELQAEAAKVTDLEAKVLVATAARDNAKRAADDAQKAFHACTPPAGQDSNNCPVCSSRLAVRVVGAGKFNLDALPAVDEAQAAIVAKAYVDAQTVHANAGSALQRAQGELDMLNAQLKLAREAAGQHSAARTNTGTVTPEQVNQAREAVRLAEERATAWEKWTEANRLQKIITSTAHIVDALDAKKGIRRTVMEAKLQGFNALMLTYASTSGWPNVTVTPEMTAELRGRPYVLLADSEQFMVRTTMQLAFAELDGSAAVVVDAMEVLENKRVSGLLKLLVHRKQVFFAGIKAEGPDKIPNLARLGAGASYWFENGTCAAIPQE